MRSRAGLLFICLPDEPPLDFDDMAAQVDLVEHGNWKLTIENNRDCHHCGGHPEPWRSQFHFFGYSAADVTPSQQEDYERFQRTQIEFERIWDAASSGDGPGPYALALHRVDAFCTGYIERLRAGLGG